MLQHIAHALAQTPVSQFIQNVLWIIPAVQTIHILAIAVVLSSVAMIDLRLFGLAGRASSIAETADRFVPWIWWGLVVLAVTGATLVTGEPVRSLTNPAFQVKMALLLVSMAITFGFQQRVRVSAAEWDVAGPSIGVRAGAIGALLIWFAIAVAGRWIAYMVIDYGA